MDVGTVGARHYRRQARIALTASRAATREWGRLDPARLTRSWYDAVGPRLVAVVAAGQHAAATGATEYVSQAVRAQGGQPEPDGTVAAAAFAGTAADGRPLDTLLYEPVITTKTALGNGTLLDRAIQQGLADLLRIVSTEVADAGRSAVGAGIMSDRVCTGYVRVLSPPSCARCTILAGKVFHTATAFARHPHCDCVNLPTIAGVAPHVTDPGDYFRSLPTAEQNRIFTASGAQAIRDGADIYSVVNASRSVTTLDAYGRKVVATLEGTTYRGGFYRQMRAEAERRTGTRFARSRSEVERGLPRFELRTPRLMPSEIYLLADGDRSEAIRLLRRFGYLT